MRAENNRVILYKHVVFSHFIEQDVEVRGNLTIKVVLPTDRPELIATPMLEPGQLASIVLSALKNEVLVARS
jgi:hypothetical protein